METQTIARRDFLKLLGASAGTIVGLQMIQTLANVAQSAEASEAGSSPHKWAMVIDQSKCTGCGQCTLTCRAHNDVPPTISWNRVIEAGQAGDKKVFLSRPCMHCEHAPCVEVCPVGASYRRADGIVMMDYDKCIGCRYCMMACPYNNRYYHAEPQNYFGEEGPTAWPYSQLSRQSRRKAAASSRPSYPSARISPKPSRMAIMPISFETTSWLPHSSSSPPVSLVVIRPR